MTERNYYDILNATSSATFEELKSNYKQLILQCHPDKLQQERNEKLLSTAAAHVDPNAATIEKHEQASFKASSSSAQCDNDHRFVIINEAWNTLKDPAKRKRYDAELLLTKFQEHSNVFEHLTLDDMEKHEGNLHEDTNGKTHDLNEDIAETFYTFNCRCGGQYVIDESTASENGIYSKRDEKKSKSHKTKSKMERSGGDGSGGGGKDSIVCPDKDKAGENSSSDDDCKDTEGLTHHDMDNDNEVMVECDECSLVIILSNAKQTLVVWS